MHRNLAFMIKQIPSFDNIHLLVIGDVMLDKFWHGQVTRISPEAPVPVVQIHEMIERPGGAANVALNGRSLGCQVTLFGRVGADRDGARLANSLENDQIKVHFDRSSKHATITKLRVMSLRQQLIRLDFEQQFAESPTPDFEQAYLAAVQQADVVIISDYAKGTIDDPQALIQAARAYGKPVLVDPKGNNYHRYQGATILTPNRYECETIIGSWTSLADLERRAKPLIQACELEALLVTLGPDGACLIFGDERASINLPTHAREVFDVTGAGDTVIATLAGAIGSQLPWDIAVEIANRAAGLVVEKLGTATVTMTELKHAVSSVDTMSPEVMPIDTLMQAVNTARSHGERIVMTNGCFDIIHPGHIMYLQQAKRLGSRLIVAVNEDHSITRLKGPNRPIHTLQDRVAVLAALTCVDWIVSFSEDTPCALIDLIRPDILVKGGDYRLEDVVGADIVLSYGGQVQVLAELPGLSTTAILEQLAVF